MMWNNIRKNRKAREVSRCEMTQLESRMLFSVASPSNLAAIPAASPVDTGSRQIALTWQDNSSNETGFIVTRSGDGVSYSNIALCAANATSFVDSSVVPGYTYYYKTCAVSGAETSDFSNVASATVAPTTVPLAPSNLSATLQKSGQGKKASLSALVTWQDNSTNERGFVFQISSDGVHW